MAKRTPSGEQLTQLIMNVFRFHGSLERHGAALTRPFKQTPARWQVLSAAWGESRTVPQVARRMGLSRQAVQRVANQLVAEELAAFMPNPAHRGSPIVRLTARGVGILTRINAAQVGWVNEVARDLDRQRLSAAVKTLTQLSALLDRTSSRAGSPPRPRRSPLRSGRPT